MANIEIMTNTGAIPEVTPAKGSAPFGDGFGCRTGTGLAGKRDEEDGSAPSSGKKEARLGSRTYTPKKTGTSGTKTNGTVTKPTSTKPGGSGTKKPLS